MYNKNLRYSSLIALLFVGFISSTTAFASVLTTIKPIGFISAAITDGVTETTVLLPDGASPHNYALKPSDVRKLNQADLVISIGEDMEIFLQKNLSKIDPKKQLVLSKLSAIAPLLRAGHEHLDEHQAHAHENEHHHEDGHGHHHGDVDLHIWLSPEIAKQIAQAIYAKLVELMPESRVQLENNLNVFLKSQDETTKKIVMLLENVKNRGYFVFHDAYGYFENYFSLTNLGHFTLNPAVKPGAKTLFNIQNTIKTQHAVCIFSESQFNPSVVEKIAKEAHVKTGNLDPLGMDIDVAKMSYSAFLFQLAEQFWNCLRSE